MSEHERGITTIFNRVCRYTMRSRGRNGQLPFVLCMVCHYIIMVGYCVNLKEYGVELVNVLVGSEKIA